MGDIYIPLVYIVFLIESKYIYFLLVSRGTIGIYQAGTWQKEKVNDQSVLYYYLITYPRHYREFTIFKQYKMEIVSIASLKPTWQIHFWKKWAFKKKKNIPLLQMVLIIA